MFKVLFWALFDVFFIFALVSFWDELGAYAFLILAFIAFFTWELYSAIKQWLE